MSEIDHRTGDVRMRLSALHHYAQGKFGGAWGTVESVASAATDVIRDLQTDSKRLRDELANARKPDTRYIVYAADMAACVLQADATGTTYTLVSSSDILPDAIAIARALNAAGDGK